MRKMKNLLFILISLLILNSVIETKRVFYRGTKINVQHKRNLANGVDPKQKTFAFDVNLKKIKHATHYLFHFLFTLDLNNEIKQKTAPAMFTENDIINMSKLITPERDEYNLIGFTDKKHPGFVIVPVTNPSAGAYQVRTLLPRGFTMKIEDLNLKIEVKAIDYSRCINYLTMRTVEKNNDLRRFYRSSRRRRVIEQLNNSSKSNGNSEQTAKKFYYDKRLKKRMPLYKLGCQRYLRSLFRATLIINLY